MASDASAVEPGSSSGGLLAQFLKKPSQEQIVLLITIALLILFSLTLPGFSSVANLLNLMRSISILGILGLGMGLIVISRGIDLSEVAIMAGSWAVGLIEMQMGVPIFWASVLALVVALSIGAINGIMVAFVEAPALFVTLAAGSVIYRRRLLVRAGLGSLCADECAFAALSRRRAALWRADADFRLCDLRADCSSLPVVHLDRPLYLLSGRQSRGSEADGNCASPADRPRIYDRCLSGLGCRADLGRHHRPAFRWRWYRAAYVFDVILVVVLGGISLIGGRGSVFSVVVGCALIGTLLNAFTIMDVNSEVQNIIRGVVLLAAIILDNWLHPRTRRPHGRAIDAPYGSSKLSPKTRGRTTTMLQKSFMAKAALTLAGFALVAGAPFIAIAQEEGGTKTARELRTGYNTAVEGKTIAFLPIALGVPLQDEWERVVRTEGAAAA